MAPNNTLAIWGNASSMNLNSLILTNIQSSPYFKNELIKLKTYHEVIDEIYYRVDHLEPWERGSRQTTGQIGMCGGVRGVGAGGIVSSAYCLLYKLYTLKLTRKQMMGILNHADSPFIRCLGFMYIRYTQPPTDLFDWFEPYFEDDEEIDAKAGGGASSTIGQIVQGMLTKQDWYSTLFPRIPVPMAKEIERRFTVYRKLNPQTVQPAPEQTKEASRTASPAAAAEGNADNGHRSSSHSRDEKRGSHDRERGSHDRERRSREGSTKEGQSESRDRRSRERDRESRRTDVKRSRSRERSSHNSSSRRDEGSRDPREEGSRDRREEGRRGYDRSRDRGDSRRHDDRYRKEESRHQRPRSRDRSHRGAPVDFADELRRERQRQKKDSGGSRDRGHRSQSR